MNKQSTPIGKWLIATVLGWLALLHVSAAPKKVLFYGPTHAFGGVAETLINNNSTEFYAIGSGSEIWSPGDINPAKDWNQKTKVHFEAFDVIVIGDPGQAGVDSALLTGAIVNRSVWTPTITGNVVIVAGDPEYHNGASGAAELIGQAIRFAADGSGRGLYVASGNLSPHESPLDPQKNALAHLLSEFGQFKLVHDWGEAVRKIGSLPILDCLTEVDLSGWGSSAHGGFHDWPAAFTPFALVTDIPIHRYTPANKLPAGISGLVHILVGQGNLKTYSATPVLGGRLIGTQHSVTVRYLNPNGTGISGATIVFDVTDGPNSSQGPVNRTTDASGTATWTYTGSNTVGRDTITASLSGSGCQPSATVWCDWSDQLVTISATDAIAQEPTFSGGPANTGTYTIYRSGSTSGELTVNLSLAGTAQPNFDYSAVTSVTFSSGQTSRTVTLSPLFDQIPEIVETAVAQIIPDEYGLYAVGSPGTATVNITSHQQVFVTVTVPDSSMDEGASNPGTFRVNRSSSSGQLTVAIQFSGTTSFGNDFVVDYPEFAGSVIMEDGVSYIDIQTLAIPDTRAEGTETIVLSALPSPASPAGEYILGSPASNALNLVDNDSATYPQNGYTLTDLGAVSSTGSFAYGVNSLSPNPHAGGNAHSVYQSPYTYWVLAYRWQNGSANYLMPPSGWGAYSGHSSAYAANDTGMVVGQSGYYQSGYVTRATYWSGGYTTANQLAPLHTANTLDNYALDINQRVSGKGGLIVGQSIRSNGKFHAVAWIPNASLNYSGAVDLGDLADGSKHSLAAAINDFAQVVGRSQISSGNNYHGFITRSQQNGSNGNQWEPEALSSFLDDMGTASLIEAHTSEFNDINAIGEVVGRGHTASGQIQAIYKVPDTDKNLGYYDLGVLGFGTPDAGTESVAHGISANGTIVGQSRLKVSGNQVWRAVVVKNAGNPGSQPLVNLNSLAYTTGSTLATSAGWTLLSAERVNAQGVIVGYGTKSGQNRAFLLTPR
ncbi:MAG: hypothetical protein J0M24_04210 [Verrucomicrobia bacterium]|nr:hypothetical protein [Verrucomicrobiota bacterium]